MAGCKYGDFVTFLSSRVLGGSGVSVAAIVIEDVAIIAEHVAGRMKAMIEALNVLPEHTYSLLLLIKGLLGWSGRFRKG